MPHQSSPVASTFFGHAPLVAPKGHWRSLRLGTKCPSLALALDNQDIPHNYVQQSVIFTTILDALTLLDNARYQKCKLVQNYATSVGIQLCYLPCYSPQLNLIERFWKFIRNECLYSKYYANFADFKGRGYR